ncbi:MAG: hypothetical protein V4479_00840, partial [Actinomycetota bacterium]
LANAKIALVSYGTANNGSYVGATASTLQQYGYNASVSGFSITITTDTANSTSGKFCIQENSASGTASGSAPAAHPFAITDSAGAAKGTCAAGVFTAGTGY